jgi:hypothetical protein
MKLSTAAVIIAAALQRFFAKRGIIARCNAIKPAPAPAPAPAPEI